MKKVLKKERQLIKSYWISLIADFRYWLLRKERQKFRICDSEQTINYILENRCSVSRYGDGELYLMTGNENGFQSYSARLAERLRDILQVEQKNHIACIPYYLKNIVALNKEARLFWEEHSIKYLKTWQTIINSDKIYYDAAITRFYIDYKDKRRSAKSISLLKRLWEGRDICIIEGEQTRLGVGNDLFCNSKSITRILCPSKNAFRKYDEILMRAKMLSSDNLILIALGMTATVLAYDLSRFGFQAIDVGHVDVEYEWMKMGAEQKVALPNKYVNEVVNGETNTVLKDKGYLDQVVARVI